MYSHTWSHLDLTEIEQEDGSFIPTSYQVALAEITLNCVRGIFSNFLESSRHFLFFVIKTSSYSFWPNCFLQNFEYSCLLEGIDDSTFSYRSMVTPHISGLFNGDALRAIKANGTGKNLLQLFGYHFFLFSLFYRIFWVVPDISGYFWIFSRYFWIISGHFHTAHCVLMCFVCRYHQHGGGQLSTRTDP